MKLSLLLLLSLVTFAARCPQKPQFPKAQPPREEKSVIVYKGEAGKTALEILKKRAKVKTSKSDLGELVVEINGIANDANRYLFYFVNGAMAKTGAANYVTQAGDVIEWKLITRTPR